MRCLFCHDTSRDTRAGVTPSLNNRTMHLHAIDLFSGIGGISLALFDVVETVLYCEWDKYCQQVLVERMSEGKLHKAPVHSDVKTLYLGNKLDANMIVGGFPCQDISCIGLQKGIADGERSSMFYEIIRIIDENPRIEYLFLENVPNILKCGLAEVIEELVLKRQWRLQWTCRSAGAFGAPHLRNRWFCLAIRQGASPVFERGAEDDMNHMWSDDWYTKGEPEKRVSLKPREGVEPDESYDENWVHRCHCLGNSVVPMVVRQAFLELAKCSSYWESISSAFSIYARKLSSVSYPYPETGLIIGDLFYDMPVNTQKINQVKIDVKIGGAAGKEPFVFNTLPTPRRGMTHASSVTDRSVRDLPTVLVHSHLAIDYMKSLGIPEPEQGKWQAVAVANVNYIEWMMGYAKDWTKVHNFKKVPKTKLTGGEDGTEDRGYSFDDASMPQDQGEDSGCEGKPKNLTATTPRRSRRRRCASSTASMTTRHSYNGMHMFMRDNVGKDVRQVAALWKTLSAEEKAHYSKLAKELR